MILANNFEVRVIKIFRIDLHSTDHVEAEDYAKAERSPLPALRRTKDHRETRDLPLREACRDGVSRFAFVVQHRRSYQ